MDLSIVIPAYNEAHKIARDVVAADKFLSDAKLTGEVIVVDDGSPDGTADAARKVATSPGVALRVIRVDPNRGKGWAVRTGMVEARGDYVMFADSGLCVPFDHALRGLKMLQNGECAIAHASRRLPGTDIVQRPALHRRILSRFFRFVTRRVMGLPRGLTDTQCGFKMYRGDVARQLYGESMTPGFMFDIEIVLRAQRHGHRIGEFPIRWECDRDSRLRTGRTAIRTIKELAAIRRTMKAEAGTAVPQAAGTSRP